MKKIDKKLIVGNCPDLALADRGSSINIFLRDYYLSGENEYEV